MISDQEHLQEIMEHKRNVMLGCIRLNRYLASIGEEETGRQLIINGYQHDLSKLSGEEWLVMRRGEPFNERFKAAVALHNHNPLNSHHPEAWETMTGLVGRGIHHMDRLHVAEMVCDFKARANEFGTDLRSYVEGPAMKRFGFSKTDEVYKWIDEFCTAICSPKFG